MTLDENGAVCRCGSRGCLETVAAAPALLELFPAADGMHRVGDITAAAAAGDASSRRVLADAGRQLGIAVGNLCNIIDPERIVVGGELAIAGEILLSPLRHALERSALVAAQGPPEVLQGELGDAAELMGAIALAVAHVAVEPESVAAG
jgi:predicted NBD/HSP70 family sugar kinase